MTFPQPITGPFGTAEISIATAEDLPEVLGLFDEAVVWLNGRGVTGQWGTTPFSASPRSEPRFMGWITPGALFVARQDGRIVGCVALAEQPPYYAAHFWQVFPATAYYLEAFTTARDRAGEGIGTALLVWADGYARQQGKDTILARFAGPTAPASSPTTSAPGIHRSPRSMWASGAGNCSVRSSPDEAISSAV